MTTYLCERCGFNAKDVEKLISHLSKSKPCPTKRSMKTREELLKVANQDAWDDMCWDGFKCG